ncbi:MAG: CarD family transcriptional regulator [Bacillota bacterium]
MYSIGDKIVYPMHGAGMIEAIEEREILGETHQYYVLRFAVGGIKVMVPVQKVNEAGLRNVIENDACEEVIERLRCRPDVECDNWNRRYRENLEKMKTGDIFEVADVVRTLAAREKEKGLSSGERKMFNNAKLILISEMVLSSEKEEDEIRQIIEKAI